MSNFTNKSKYDKILEKAIPNLENMKYLFGSEGYAYFLDDDFIIKRFFGFSTSRRADFEKYFQELQKFKEKGYSVPNVYAWAENIDSSNVMNYYLLEERIKGEHIFELFVDAIYYYCKDFCSEEEFSKAIALKQGSLYLKILETFVQTFIKRELQLLSLPDSELENFIMGNYNMAKEQYYSFLDIHSDNVLFDGKKIITIDNGFAYEPNNITDKEAKYLVLEGIVNIMLDNPNSSIFNLKNRDIVSNNTKLRNLISRNKRVYEACFKKMIDMVNKLINPIVTDESEYASWIKYLNKMFSESKSIELLSNIERSF